ncbi:hypothetical protein CkaCkLH20_13038 [Colletotrichum karsti]|uniref:Uncharacterized protein n=1 Tax=Colletotrichum karsti TaxID=1095194 RepID=A0A9P6I086_9PEZI|nr:uncharacterized protein CkaCkLH20_13038 [Colletotrichum karsti]KAF9869500.1 hypothetical protein CkaCkLH20_13038 [Colletotrichum karsti]
MFQGKDDDKGSRAEARASTRTTTVLEPEHEVEPDLNGPVLPQPTTPTLAKYSTTTSKLRVVTRDIAQSTLQRLIDGYDDKPGGGYPAEFRQDGCLVVQKKRIWNANTDKDAP